MKKKLAKKIGSSNTKEDDTLGLLFTSPPDKQDDLREISGLGPKFAEKLNELGIYQFAQIATWKAKTIDAIAEQIGAGPRIRKEKWVQQAKRLAK